MNIFRQSRVCPRSVVARQGVIAAILSVLPSRVAAQGTSESQERPTGDEVACVTQERFTVETVGCIPRIRDEIIEGVRNVYHCLVVGIADPDVHIHASVTCSGRRASVFVARDSGAREAREVSLERVGFVWEAIQRALLALPPPPIAPPPAPPQAATPLPPIAPPSAPLQAAIPPPSAHRGWQWSLFAMALWRRRLAADDGVDFDLWGGSLGASFDSGRMFGFTLGVQASANHVLALYEELDVMAIDGAATADLAAGTRRVRGRFGLGVRAGMVLLAPGSQGTPTPPQMGPLFWIGPIATATVTVSLTPRWGLRLGGEFGVVAAGRDLRIEDGTTSHSFGMIQRDLWCSFAMGVEWRS